MRTERNSELNMCLTWHVSPSQRYIYIFSSQLLLNRPYLQRDDNRKGKTMLDPPSSLLTDHAQEKKEHQQAIKKAMPSPFLSNKKPIEPPHRPFLNNNNN